MAEKYRGQIEHTPVNNTEGIIEKYEELVIAGRKIDYNSEYAPVEQRDLVSNFKSLVTNKNTERNSINYFVKENLGVILDHIHLPSSEILDAWDKCTTTLDLTNPEHIDLRNYYYNMNFLTLLSLELNGTNNAQVLHNEFGIKTFGRYGVNFLFNQLENRDNREIPYGITILPRDDFNGAFYKEKQILDTLSGELEDRYTIRAYEAETKLDLVKHLIKAQKRYGPNGKDGHKISFGILNGHGLNTAIEFSKGNFLSTLDTYFLSQGGKDKLKDIFREEGSLILESCSTGEVGGIAQQLADILNVNVFAPEKVSGIGEIDVRMDDGLKFDVKYADPENIGEFVKTQIYKPGERRERLHLDLRFEPESHNYNPVVFQLLNGD